jgi:SNF2 family DNA or RNA helicase
VRVKALRRRRAWALSGTPLENRVADLASILEFVAARPEGGPAPAPASLGARQAEVQLRRRKADVLADLPPKLVGTLALSLTGAQRESYLRAEREGVVRLRAWGPDVPIAHVLELILRLKQLCNACLASGRSAKLEDLAARLPAHMAAGDRVLVFSQFADDRFGARAIARHLAAWEPLVYTGGLPPSEREATLAAFKRDPARRLLVLSLRAGGTGLDLPEANVVYHVDRWWNPALMRQAEDRAHRHGQTRPVQVYQYLVEETIETRIAALLEAKQALFDAWIDPVSLDLGSRFGREELLGLVGA